MSGLSGRARRAGTLAFAAQGYVLTTILASLPVVRDRYGISEDDLTFAVLGVLLAAVAGSAVADRLTRRAGGSRVALAAGLLGIAATIPLVALAPTFPVAIAAFALYGVALGMVDAGTNMQGVAVQRAAGRPLMSSFHAGWSVGAVVGALVCSATVMWLPYDPVMLVFLPGVLVAAGAGWLQLRDGQRSDAVVVQELLVLPAPDAAGPGDARAAQAAAPTGPGGGEDGDDERAPVAAAIPWGPLVVLGVCLLAFYAADNAAQTWGSLYVESTLDAAAWLGPLTLAAYLVTALVPRLLGDGAVRRWGRVRVVRAASLIAAAGLGLVVAAPGAGLALVGFAVAGAGLGLGAPLCFSAAGALDPDNADAVVARLNVFNYGGTLLGAVLVGIVSGFSSLRVGFLLPIALVLVITALSGRFAAHDEAEAARRDKELVA
ncbi:MFS transporter [Cellulomonas persica]|uniref:MFS transporter n=1 Tax=Cellulomonas persica TaxID=76861 RepID=A0A510UV18_9CELL|nr:MFS transporter [Cellulomonas persica]GEK18527.1 MFS transporter [Cellulomonas persica]